MYRSAGVVLLLLSLTACSASGGSPGSTGGGGSPTDGGRPSRSPLLEGSIDPGIPAELLDAVAADARARAGQPDASIRVLRAQPAEWNDGSLGCPRPGEFYTQALVSGYWIVLEIGGTAYDYRASERGGFTLCENPAGAPGSS